MDDINRADVTVDLKDVYGETITDTVVFTFRNQNVVSLSRRLKANFTGTPVILEGLPAFPTGLYLVDIVPTAYRFKTVVLNVSSDSTKNLMQQDFFVDPSDVNPKSMQFSDLPGKTYQKELLRILDSSGLDEEHWDALDNRNRATILNLSAKMTKNTTKDGQPLIEQVRNLDRTLLTSQHRARIFSLVNDDLLDKLRSDPDTFQPVDGSLHNFPKPWRPVTSHGSFKTRDAAGNIQLTFAISEGALLADIDLDDHAGIKHIFDVIGHSISKKDTDPYDIHEILRYFQHIDPEYRLI
jgi:hypothetical protein